MAYATVDDLIKRWKPLDGHEAEQAAILLEDAALLIDSLLSSHGKTAADVSERALTAVSCNVVRRSLDVSAEYAGLSQYSQTAGAYTFQGTIANPNSNLFLTKAEKKMLGVSSGRLGFIRPAIGVSDDTW